MTDDEKLEAVVKLRLTTAQYEALSTAAVLEHRTVSQHLRMLVERDLTDTGERAAA